MRRGPDRKLTGVLPPLGANEVIPPNMHKLPKETTFVSPVDGAVESTAISTYVAAGEADSRPDESKMEASALGPITTASRYARPNQHIQMGMVQALYEGMAHCTLGDLVDISENLGTHSEAAWTCEGETVTMADIACLEGDGVYGDASKSYWFSGGPEQAKASNNGNGRFTVCFGSALTWIIDQILLRISENGPGIVDHLEIPFNEDAIVKS